MHLACGYYIAAVLFLTAFCKSIGFQLRLIFTVTFVHIIGQQHNDHTSTLWKQRNLVHTLLTGRRFKKETRSGLDWCTHFVQKNF